MRIALVCPSNTLYMPYVGNYEVVLKENKVNYDIINWDRFGIENIDGKFVYRDSKIGHRRKFLDYYKYSKFIKSRLLASEYDKIIVFGLQLAFFLQDVLKRKYIEKYIIDIRDYNKIINFFHIKKLIDNSGQIVVSSPGYKEWLPYSDKIIINHNTRICNVDEIKPCNVLHQKSRIKIANIGAIRDYKVNIDFINSVKNSNNIDLYYHGYGGISKDIQNYVDSHGITNVYFTGRYNKSEEALFYENVDLINVLRYNDSLNNRTALPNRLYNSVYFAKPMLALKGTYLADIVHNYHLGIVLDSFINVDKVIYSFINELDVGRYHQGRLAFFNSTISDNCMFVTKLSEFVTKL